MFPGVISSRRAQKIDSTLKPSVQPLARRIAAHVNHTGLTGGGWEAPGCPWRSWALQMRSLAPSTVREFEKERTRLGPKSDFFLA